MSSYILLTRIPPNSLKGSDDYLQRNSAVVERINDECPQVIWKANYAVSGPYDYLDIFEAPDNETAARVALIVRTTGGAETEMWTATRWNAFKSMVSNGDKGETASPDDVGEADRESFPASDAPSFTGSAAT